MTSWSKEEPRELLGDGRLTELALAMITPWPGSWSDGGGYPNYWWQGELDSPEWNARMHEVLESTKNERYPWEYGP